MHGGFSIHISLSTVQYLRTLYLPPAENATTFIPPQSATSKEPPQILSAAAQG